MELIQEILRISEEKFNRFIEDTQRLLKSSSQMIEANLDQEKSKNFFVNMHTIKGAARTLGLKNMTVTIHQIENYYTQLIQSAIDLWDKEKLKSDLNEAISIVEQYLDLNTNTLKRNQKTQNINSFLTQKLKSFAESELSFEQREKMNELLSELEFWDYLKIDDLVASLESDLEQIAKSLNKPSPKLKLQCDFDLLLHPALKRFLENSFTHILRNILDHGIESPIERLKEQKPEYGAIYLRISQSDTQIEIAIYDDGRGLALEKIREKARKQGLLSNTAQSQEDIARLIFHHGFSTAEQVSEFSGRGVGMSALKEFAKELNNTQVDLKLLTEKANGFYDFELRLNIDNSYVVSKSFSKAC